MINDTIVFDATLLITRIIVYWIGHLAWSPGAARNRRTEKNIIFTSVVENKITFKKTQWNTLRDYKYTPSVAERW